MQSGTLDCHGLNKRLVADRWLWSLRWGADFEYVIDTNHYIILVDADTKPERRLAMVKAPATFHSSTTSSTHSYRAFLGDDVLDCAKGDKPGPNEHVD